VAEDRRFRHFAELVPGVLALQRLGENIPLVPSFADGSEPEPFEEEAITFNNDDIAAEQDGSSRGMGTSESTFIR
jgi:hypothetical protein